MTGIHHVFLGPGVSVLVHGGAGAPRDDAGRVASCRRAASEAHRVLMEGGTALDAVESAVVLLEDDPLFNAGYGAALTDQGTVELDASIMDGGALDAGAVCALTGFKNAISAARAALEEGRHVMYAGDGAAELARRNGLREVDPASLITEAARRSLKEALATGTPFVDGGNTVGAVARDTRGNVAAATSTGGVSGQRAGRVGDSPVLGAGTYADNESGAVSATGDGEGILRCSLSSLVITALRSGQAPDRAATEALRRMRARVGATGGLIVADKTGHLGLARSSESMPWAARWDSRGEASGT